MFSYLVRDHEVKYNTKYYYIYMTKKKKKTKRKKYYKSNYLSYSKSI